MGGLRWFWEGRCWSGRQPAEIISYSNGRCGLVCRDRDGAAVMIVDAGDVDEESRYRRAAASSALSVCGSVGQVLFSFQTEDRDGKVGGVTPLTAQL